MLLYLTSEVSHFEAPRVSEINKMFNLVFVVCKELGLSLLHLPVVVRCDFRRGWLGMSEKSFFSLLTLLNQSYDAHFLRFSTRM